MSRRSKASRRRTIQTVKKKKGKNYKLQVRSLLLLSKTRKFGPGVDLRICSRRDTLFFAIEPQFHRGQRACDNASRDEVISVENSARKDRSRVTNARKCISIRETDGRTRWEDEWIAVCHDRQSIGPPARYHRECFTSASRSDSRQGRGSSKESKKTILDDCLCFIKIVQ